MKSYFISLWLCLITLTLIGQDLREIDTFIDQEKTYQSLFYLRALEKNLAKGDFVTQFKINNRLIDAFQLSKAPADSIVPLLRYNTTHYSKIKDTYEQDYYAYIKGVQEILAGLPNEGKETFKKISEKNLRFKGYVNLKLGDLLQDQRKFSESINSFKKALKAFQTDSLQFYMKIYRCHYLSGISYKNLSELEAAEVQYEEALALLTLIPDPLPAERAKLLNNLANVYNVQNEYSKAQTAYLEALILKEKIVKDSLSIGTTYSNLAGFYTRYGNFTKARNYFEKALSILPSPKYASEQVNSNSLFYNYGSLLREFGEFSKSQDITKQALSTSVHFLNTNDVSVIRLKLGLAEDAISLDDIDLASKTMIETFPLLNIYESNDPIRQEYDLTLINYLDKAMLYDSCFKLSKRLVDHYRETSRENSEGLYYATIKEGNSIGKLKPGEALPYYKQAYRIAESSNQLHKVLFTLNVQALEFLQAGELDSASFYTKQVILKNFVKDSSRKSTRVEFIDENLAIGSFERMANINFLKYKAGGQLELLQQAEEQITLAIQLIQKKRELLLMETDKLEFGAFVEEVYPLAADIYYQAYDQFGNSAYIDRMLFVAELSKAQSLLLNLKKQRIETFAGITNAINKKESELSFQEKNLLHDIAFQVSLNDDFNQEVFAEQNRNLKALQKEKSVFLDSIQKHLPGYYELKYDQSLIGKTALLNELPDKTLFLEYLNGQDRLYVMGISNQKVFILPLSKRAEVEKSISLLRNHLKFKYQEELLSTAQHLYHQLLNPADSLMQLYGIKPAALVIIPDASLTLLPFELLVDRISKKGAPHYIIENYPIYYNYSATLFWQKTTDPKISLKKGMVNFAPTFSSLGTKTNGTLREEVHEDFQFDELLETGNEVSAIANVYRKKMDGTSQIYDQQANEANFKQIKFDQLSFVHLATHGFAGFNGPKSSGLAFKRNSDKTEDDILFAEEVYNLKMPVELVTLSACETGLGKYYSGEGLVGLARAFFYAGARSVIVSLWKVQDKSTAKLMSTFYSDYFSPLPDKSEALREAKIKMIRSKEFKHPFYWSPFILVGAN